jgi:hypothetical protein
MALHAAWTQLDGDLNLLSVNLRNFASKKPLVGATDFSILDECLLEGLLSRVWQALDLFCRTCVIESCMGTTNGAGIAIVGLPDAVTAEHVSGAAMRAKRGTTPCWGSPNAILRHEPTWGDVDVLSRIITHLRPANFTQMLAAFSSGYRGAKALQAIRNGAAHNHVQNLGDIHKLRSAYLVFPIGHPTHAMFWIEPQSQDFLVTHAIDELKDAGLAAIS